MTWRVVPVDEGSSSSFVPIHKPWKGTNSEAESTIWPFLTAVKIKAVEGLFDDRLTQFGMRARQSSDVFCPSITEELASFRRYPPQRAAVFLEFHQFKADWNAACLWQARTPVGENSRCPVEQRRTLMFRKSTVLVCPSILAVALAFGAAANAQETTTPQFEIGASYSWLHVNSADDAFHRTGNGGSGYIEYNINSTVGLVADFGGYANTRSGINDDAMTYLFGPRFNWRHSRLTPYVQFLFGGAYAWTPGGPTSTQNGFATAAGGGLDYQVSNHLAIKPIQVEYVMTQFPSALGFGSHQNDLRYSAGVVFRLGAK